MAEIDGTAIIAEHWPLDGPYTPESVAAAAAAIRELNRYIAHATLGDTTRVSLPYAPDGYTVVGRLVTAARSQEQVLRQLEAWAQGLSGPDLRHDEDRTSIDAAIAAAQVAAVQFERAAHSSGALAYELETAQQQLGHLYHNIDE